MPFRALQPCVRGRAVASIWKIEPSVSEYCSADTFWAICFSYTSFFLQTTGASATQMFAAMSASASRRSFRRGIRTTATSSARTRTSRRRSSTTCGDSSAGYYAPNNASLAIVGDFEPAEAKALVEKYFGTLKRGPAVPPVKVETPKITAERRKVVPSRVELPRVYMAWLTPPIFKPGDADADIAATDSRRRPFEPPVQEAGLRAADRAGRVAPCSSR